MVVSPGAKERHRTGSAGRMWSIIVRARPQWNFLHRMRERLMDRASEAVVSG